MAADLLGLLVGGHEVVDLSRPLHAGVPRYPTHPVFQLDPVQRHGDGTRPDGTSVASEVMTIGGHVGTHVDALAHFALNGRLFGGADATEAQRDGRFLAQGSDHIPAGVFRGLHLDVATTLGHDMLPGGFAISADHLREAAERAGAWPRRGDVVLVRTGWGQRFDDPVAYLGADTGCPGVAEDAAAWLADQGVVMTGADTLSYEVVPHPRNGHLSPVHRLLLTERGVNIIEVLDLEPLAGRAPAVMALVVAPLSIAGATGAPARVLALVPAAPGRPGGPRQR